jgi:hypothetical protein
MLSRVLALVVSSVCLIACSGEDPEPNHFDPPANDGGNGEEGGDKPSPGDGARPCVDSGDCDGRNGVPLCNVDVCVSGFCQAVFDAFGVLCGVPEKGEICNGKGQCGEWMPIDATECYTAIPLQPACPLCDDGDPATHDTCATDDVTQARYCTNVPADEGFACGLSYTIQGGKCCPGQPPTP